MTLGSSSLNATMASGHGPVQRTGNVTGILDPLPGQRTGQFQGRLAQCLHRLLDPAAELIALHGGDHADHAAKARSSFANELACDFARGGMNRVPARGVLKRVSRLNSVVAGAAPFAMEVANAVSALVGKDVSNAISTAASVPAERMHITPLMERHPDFAAGKQHQCRRHALL